MAISLKLYTVTIS